MGIGPNPFRVTLKGFGGLGELAPENPPGVKGPMPFIKGGIAFNRKGRVLLGALCPPNTLQGPLAL